MAACRIMPLHLTDTERAVADVLNRSIEYIKNPLKTDDGRLIECYGCAPETAISEFILSKKMYEQKTGRTEKKKKDVVAYMVRQSFSPGEITPEEAMKIGYELAAKLTKGRHSFIVSTHIDTKCVHNHIIFNSTRMDLSKKFRYFLGIGRVVMMMSDLICLAHNLSIIKPLSYDRRIRRPKEEIYGRRASHRDYMRADIDKIIANNPKDLSDFKRQLKAKGYEIKEGKYLSIKHESWGEKGRFKRLKADVLGVGYDIEGVIERMKDPEERKAAGESKFVVKVQKEMIRKAKDPEREKLQLLIDLESEAIKEKGIGYQTWARRFNTQQIAKTVVFLKANGITTRDDLKEIIKEYADEKNNLGSAIRKYENQLEEIKSVKMNIINYSKYKDIYNEYKSSGYSKKYYDEHKKEIEAVKASKKYFNSVKGEQPKLKELNAAYQNILKEKSKLHSEYKMVNDSLKNYQISEKIIEEILHENSKKLKEKSTEKER